MPITHLHLISFDIPFPANYGGVIDVFYKLKAWQSIGVKVILHTFQYGDRKPQPDLEKYAEKVIYYSRNTSIFTHFSAQPYIVKSRQHARLLDNLLLDDFPIVAEGLHCSACLQDPQLARRIKVLRMHNIEWQYYRRLAETTTSVLHRLFFIIESKKLKKYEEKITPKADLLLGITESDTQYFKQKSDNVVFVPPFHPFEKIEIEQGGKGDFALFHGKLSVPDNEKSALFLIENVFSKTDYKFVIAGRDPSFLLQKKIAQYSNISLVANPNNETMTRLQKDAQIHVLYTYQSEGMKLKLLAALFAGKHCLVNPKMVENTDLASLCHLASSPADFLLMLTKLKDKVFSESDISERKKQLEQRFSNKENAQKIIAAIEKMLQ